MSNGDGEKRLDCLICTNELSVTSSFSIFYTVIPHSGHLLANVIQKVLRICVEQSSLSSTFVCKKCFSKFQEYDRAEEKCNNLKKDILKIFNYNCEKRDPSLVIQGVACQTEDISDTVVTESESSVGVKLEVGDSSESDDEADDPAKFNDSNENQESKTPRNKRKSQPAKKTTPTSSTSEKDVSIAPATSESPEKCPNQSEGERSQNSPIDDNPKFEIRTKDARRRRRYVHPCALCGRLFRRPCEVKQHLLSHGGAKPYRCQLCLRRFGSKSGAGIHALKKHGKDVTVENIIEVCNDIVSDGSNGGYPPETIKELLEQNMKEDNGKDRTDGSDSSDGDDDFEWKLENEDELFGGGNNDDDDDSKHNFSGGDTTSQHGISEAEGDISNDAKIQKEDIDGKTLKDTKGETNVQKENERKPERKTKAASISKIAAAAAATVSSNSGNGSEDGRKKRKRKKRDPLPKVPKHECPICGKMWRTMSEFKSHVNTHSDERPYICEICGQAYKHKAALDIHVGMHNGINPFCCPYCNKAFTQKGALQRHMPIHTGEAPFQCELCGKRFVHHTSFNMHTLAHTGQKSYKCQVCGLALLSGSHLKRHSRVHTGERPYQCTTCGKRFAERYNLVAHTRVHDPLGHGSARESSKKLHKCQLCGASFDRRPKLEDHLALSHNKISDADDSRKWVGHLISTELGGHPVLQQGQTHPLATTPNAVHSQTLPSQQLAAVSASGVGHPPPPLIPGNNHAQPAPAPEHHHPHHHAQQQQPHHPPTQQQQPPQPPQQQQQHVWHHVLFGKGPDSHVDADQHRLLSEMSALGAGLGAPGRGVLSSCLASGHPSLGGHPHHMGNPHALGPTSRLNMFGADTSN